MVFIHINMKNKFDSLFLQALPELKRYGYTVLLSRNINSVELNIDDIINNVYIELYKSTTKDPSRFTPEFNKFKGACMKYMKYQISEHLNPTRSKNRTICWSRYIISDNLFHYPKYSSDTHNSFEDFQALYNSDKQYHQFDEKKLNDLINSYHNKRAVQIFRLNLQGYEISEIAKKLKISNSQVTKDKLAIKAYLKLKLKKPNRRSAIGFHLKFKKIKEKNPLLDKIENLLKQRISVLEISRQLNIDRSTIYHNFNVKSYGVLKTSKFSFNMNIKRNADAAEKKELVRNMMNKGLTNTEISRQTGVDRCMVIYYKKKIENERKKR